jgi:hypothetical protein
MGNINSQQTTVPNNPDDKVLSEQSIITVFIVIIILYMSLHCVYNYKKCNTPRYTHYTQLTAPVMDGYGMYNNRLNMRVNPTMKQYDTSNIRYNVRTAEGGNLIEHLNSTCKASYTNDEINCVQAYISRSKDGGTAMASKSNDNTEYDRSSALLRQDSSSADLGSGWSSSGNSRVANDSYNIDGQSYYGSVNQGLRPNANSGNNTSFNSSANSYGSDLNISNYGSANQGLRPNANSGNNTSFNSSANSYGSDLNISDPIGNSLPLKSNNSSEYSDSILMRDKPNINTNPGTLNNRMRANSYNPDNAIGNDLNTSKRYNMNNNNLSKNLNIGINNSEMFSANNTSNNSNFSIMNKFAYPSGKLNKLLSYIKKK